jgi:hypothetical protein
MKEYILNKFTLLDFKNKYLDNQNVDVEYSDPYFNVLKIKLNNKELFDKENFDLLYEIEDTINAIEFSNNYCKQRYKDMNDAKKSGYTHDIYEDKMNALKDHEKKFQKNYSDVLYFEGMQAINKYVEGAQKLGVKGELFFMGIMNFIDIHSMEFTPHHSEIFNPNYDIDEKALRARIQAAFDVLENNKDQWI